MKVWTLVLLLIYCVNIHAQRILHAKDVGLMAGVNKDQSAQMQSAIDSAASARMILQLEEGTYQVAKNLKPRSGLHLRGKGSKTIIQFTSDTVSMRYLFNSEQAVNDLILEDLTLDANGNNNSGKDIFCFRLKWGRKLLFKNVQFTGSKTVTAVWVYMCEGMKFLDCKFYDNGAHALQLWGGKNILVYKCHFTSWGVSDSTRCALSGYVKECINVTIKRSRFINTVGKQFAIETAGNYMRGWKVYDNYFEGNGLGGNGISGQIHTSEFYRNVFRKGNGSHRSGFEIVGHNNKFFHNDIEAGSMVITGSRRDIFKDCCRNIQVLNNRVVSKGENNGGITIGGWMPFDSVLVKGNYINTMAAKGNSSAVFVGVYGSQTGRVTNLQFINNIIYTNASGFRMFADSGSHHILLSKNKVMSAAYWLSYHSDTFSDVILDQNEIHAKHGEEILYAFKKNSDQ